MMKQTPFQDLIPGNHCWGCGPLNEGGLQIKSRWSRGEPVCIWQPSERHMAGPQHILNEGIIASIIDCHCVCTAIAAAYRAEGREIGSGQTIWYATGSLQIRYKRPTPINEHLTLRARITETTEKRTNLTCSLYSGGDVCAIGEVVAVRVPAEWLADGR